MSVNSPNNSFNGVLELVIKEAEAKLIDFANRSDFISIFEMAFGDGFDVEKIKTLCDEWLREDVVFPEIEIFDLGILKGTK